MNYVIIGVAIGFGVALGQGIYKFINGMLMEIFYRFDAYMYENYDEYRVVHDRRNVRNPRIKNEQKYKMPIGFKG